MNKMYAQFNEEGICFCVGSPKTDVEATYDCLGKKYVNGEWVEPESELIEATGEQVTQEEGLALIPDEAVDEIYNPLPAEEVVEEQPTE